jgi:hypothetical protein
MSCFYINEVDTESKILSTALYKIIEDKEIIPDLNIQKGVK